MKALSQIDLAEILAANARLAGQSTGQSLAIRVLANVTVAPLKDILEYELRRHGLDVVVELGDYDNIAQNALESRSAAATVVFWELVNLVDLFASRALAMDDATIAEVEARTLDSVGLVLESLRDAPLVLFNKFSAMLLNATAPAVNALDRIAAALNSRLQEQRQRNLHIIDIDKCIASVSIEKAVNWRTWQSARLLHSPDYFKSYATLVAPHFYSLTAKSKKALIFDCDNTLWGGIVGEDGPRGIDISTTTRPGRAFYEVQCLALALQRQGVILGLCSKNNPADVDEVLHGHPDMVLRDDHFAIKRVNWNDKASNLQEIATTLNIGLDSIVFVDDSEFEASLIEQCLPQIQVLRVPKSLSEYPQYLRDHMRLFWSSQSTVEDANRSLMYRQQVEREQARSGFSSLDDYLRSLGLTLEFYCDAREHVARIAQLTQKTNQFNLTTKRYSESEIAGFMEASSWLVDAFSLRDRFGDQGLTGVALLRLDDATGRAEIDTLLLSCRVIGRRAEIRFLDCIMDQLRTRGFHTVVGRFIRTPKNAQVSTFFEARGFKLVRGDEDDKVYEIDLGEYRCSDLDYIRVERGE